MKTIDYWEMLHLRARTHLAHLDGHEVRRPVLRGRPRQLRTKIWALYLDQWREAEALRRKKLSLERRMAFYEFRIAALRSRTAFDRLRQGEPRL